MRALIAILTALGTVAGIVVGVVAHHRASQGQGWTLYEPPPGRRYADYLPGGHVSWFPGIIEYAAIGLGAGLIAAGVLAAMRFRLVRTPRGQ